MAVRFKCPNCGRYQTASAEDVGQTLLCMACGTKFLFDPGSAVTQPSPTPPVSPADPSVAFDSGNEYPLAGAPRRRRRFTFVALSLVILAGALLAYQVVKSKQTGSSKPSTSPTQKLPMTTAADQLGVDLRNTSTATTIPSPTEPASRATSQAAQRASSFTVEQPPPSPSTAATSQALSPGVIEPTTRPTTLPSTAPVAAARFHPRPAATQPADDLDDQIGRSIDRGVAFLLAQLDKGRLKLYSGTSGQSAGEDALVVYALLQAGEATRDPRLGPNSPLVDQLLTVLKSININRDHTVYARSLRSAALSVYHRAQDKAALRADANWLMHADSEGAFDYEAISSGNRPINLRTRFGNSWDNSNSQYGALGVWAAAEAGVEVPGSFWNRVQQHWLDCQLKDGQWAYAAYTRSGRLSMTVAGLTTLFVASDQLEARAVVATVGHPPFTPAIRRSIDWLEAGNNSIDLPESWRTYNLFGLERAALASGFKYFGKHDWYRELARQQLDRQLPNGSWTGEDATVDTACTLLFLSRGRHPIFMNKLRFDGFWANRPRDIANLAHFASTALERPLNWQVVSLTSDWSDWMDSPVLYIASHEPPTLTDADVDKLRAYALAGGLIFTHADGDSVKFNQFVATLGRRLFPAYPLQSLPSDHPIYSTLYKVKPQPPLQGISNGSRLLLVHSPTDLNKGWQQQDWQQRPAAFQLGINLFIYAAGKANFQNKLKTPYVPEPAVVPALTTQLAELRYPGDWNPEPAAMPRFARLFLGETGVRLASVATDAARLDAAVMPVAHLTGTGKLMMSTDELKAVHDYVAAGGTLLIDPAGGSPEFVKSILLDFLPHAFPDQTPGDLKPSHPILAGTNEGMKPVTPRLRPYRGEVDGMTTTPIEYFSVGKGLVLFSQVDLTTALLGTHTWPINGYDAESAYGLVRNILLFTLER